MSTQVIIHNSNIDSQLDLEGSVLFVQLTNALTKEKKTFKLELSSTSEFTFEYANNLQVTERIVLTLKSGTGSILTSQGIKPNDIIGKPTFQLSFAFNPVNLTSGIGKISPVAQLIQGKLIDSRAQTNTENVQIIISASSLEQPDQMIMLQAITTEPGGYFVLPKPVGLFAQAQANIGLKLENTIIHINLESTEEGLNFPDRLLLVFESALPDAQAEDSCGCNELNMPAQGRVLDEFSFYAVVRTSDPEISAQEITDEEITINEILQVYPSISVPVYEILKKEPGRFFGNTSPLVNTLANVSTRPRVSSARDGANSVLNVDLDNDAEMFTNTTPLSDNQVKGLLQRKIKRSTVRQFLAKKNKLDVHNFHLLLQAQEARDLGNLVLPAPAIETRGRLELDANQVVDWDNEPTLYEARTIAYGHLLHYKQQWIADGYSLGDLIYSLPLAPGQKKQIVTYDWEHRVRASQSENLIATDSLTNVMSRDRDINEIAAGTVREHIHGKSSSTVKTAAGGFGGAIGPIVFGAAGGISKASSTATQDSMRAIASSNSQQLSDRTAQAASSVRSQRSTVIQTVSQGETSSVTTESVANYNHCHAITIQYFEVLRHFRIKQKLADVQECLFVPLPITQFDLEKALRWREILSDVLMNSDLRRGFKALFRVQDNWRHANFPLGSYADENVKSISGHVKVKINLVCPSDMYNSATDKMEFNPANWTWMQEAGLGDPASFYINYLKDKPNKDQIFRDVLGNQIAEKIISFLQTQLLNDNENAVGPTLDLSLASKFYNNAPLHVSTRANNTGVARKNIQNMKFSLIESNNKIPPATSIIITSGQVGYRTEHRHDLLFSNKSMQDDISASDTAVVYTAPTFDELKNPKDDDVMLANELIHHLNSNLEYYHTEIFKFMTPERRFLLLDGINLYLPNEQQSRSVASLVENRLIGIVGNSLVFPVVPGLNVNPDFSTRMLNGDTEEIVPLKQFYDHDPVEDRKVSVPTRGVFAEAMIGKCNSCEIKDENRFWRWEESMIPDNPTSINPVTLSTPAVQAVNLTPNPLSNPIINIQNALDAPDPSGVDSVLTALGKSDTFKDITGLEGNQANAMSALTSAMTAASNFGTMGLERGKQVIEKQKFDRMTQLLESGKINKLDFDKTIAESSKPQALQDLESINNAVKNGNITKDQGENLIQKPLNEQIADIEKLMTNKSLSQEEGGKLIADLIRKANGLVTEVEKPEAKKEDKPVAASTTSTTPPPPPPTPPAPPISGTGSN